MSTERGRRRGTWSLELALAVLLPVLTIVACVALIRLSTHAGFTTLDTADVTPTGPAP